MAKRQKRFDSKEVITNNIHQLSGKKVNIVFKDKRVLIGEITELTDQYLRFRNMRQKTQQVTLNDIEEIILDFLDADAPTD